MVSVPRNLRITPCNIPLFSISHNSCDNLIVCRSTRVVLQTYPLPELEDKRLIVGIKNLLRRSTKLNNVFFLYSIYSLMLGGDDKRNSPRIISLFQGIADKLLVERHNLGQFHRPIPFDSMNGRARLPLLDICLNIPFGLTEIGIEFVYKIKQVAYPSKTLILREIFLLRYGYGNIRKWKVTEHIHRMIEYERVFRHSVHSVVCAHDSFTYYSRRIDKEILYTLVFYVLFHGDGQGVVFIHHITRYFIPERHYRALVCSFVHYEVVEWCSVGVLYRESFL